MAKLLKLKNSDFFPPIKAAADNVNIHTAEAKHEIKINV